MRSAVKNIFLPITEFFGKSHTPPRADKAVIYGD